MSAYGPSTHWVVKEGYLKKSPPPDRSLAIWHKRYFVLWSSRLMEYYSSSEKRPQDYLKTVDLSNCEDMVAPMPLQKKVNVIKLSIREKGRVRDYFFECESESEMNKWVCSLAEVLGFMPVDDEPIDIPGIQSNGYPLTPAPTAAAVKPSPLPALNSRPRMATPPSTPKFQQSVGPSRLQQQATLLAEMDGPEGEYEIPVTVMEQRGEALYHTLTPPDGEEDGPSAHYEEIDIDEEQLSKNPPPVWESEVGFTPPPLPSRPRPQTWKRSLERNENYSLLSSEEPQENSNPNFQGRPLPVPPENSSQVRKQKTPDQRSSPSPRLERRKPPAIEMSPPVRRSPAAFERSISAEQVHNQGEMMRENRRPASYEPGGSRKPLPPPKPKPGVATGTANQSRYVAGFGFDLKNDPRFAQKLKERKQELYGVTDVVHPDEDFSRPGGDYPQDSYEEVAFTANMEAAEPLPPPRLPPPRNVPERMTLPPRRHNPASQLVDSVAAEGNNSSAYDEPMQQPHSFLVVDYRSEHSHNEDTNPALFMARPPIQPKSPSLRWEIEQESTSEQPQPLARTVRHMAPHPRANYAKAAPVVTKRSASRSPEIPRRGMGERRASDPDLVSPPPFRVPPISNPVPTVRKGSTPTSPPPLPSREVIRPTAQEDMHPRPPLRKKDRERSPLPAIPVEEMGPPVPLRNQSAGRQGHSPPPSYLRPLSTSGHRNGSDELVTPTRSRSSLPPMSEAGMTSNTPRVPPKPAERLQANIIMTTVNHNGDSRPRPMVHPRVTRMNSSDKPKPPIAKKPTVIMPKHHRDNPPVENSDRNWQTTGGGSPPVARPRPPAPPPKRW